MLLLKIAFVLAVVAPLIVGADLGLAAFANLRGWSGVEAWFDRQLSRFALATVVFWTVAVIVGVLSWVSP